MNTRKALATVAIFAGVLTGATLATQATATETTAGYSINDNSGWGYIVLCSESTRDYYNGHHGNCSPWGNWNHNQNW